MRTSMRRFSRLLALGLAVGAVGWMMPAAAAPSPATGSRDVSGTITQTFNAGPAVQIGMLVAASSHDPSTVVPLKSNQLKAFLGVVIPTANAPIVLTPETIAHQQVLVAQSGRYNLLVSDQNGAIKPGDYLTLSALSGIAMKAGTSQGQAVGQAATGFSGSGNVISSTTLKDSNGHAIAVNIGRIPASINISNNPLFQKASNYVPGVVAKVALSVANKQVSVARIYLCAAILVMVAFIAGVMLYSGIQGSMKAIGRNPLARKSIFKGLAQTTLSGLTIFIAGVFAVYLLLKL